MTPEILQWLKSLDQLIDPQCEVLELGSYNVNGSARSAILHSDWIGLDIIKGPDVDIVVSEQETYRTLLRQRNYTPGVFVCCECLEHVRDPIATLNEFKMAMRESMDMRRDAQVPGHLESLLILTSPSYHFQYHAYPKDYWRFSKDTFEDVFFDSLEPLYIGYLDSNEGPNTTVAGIARLT